MIKEKKKENKQPPDRIGDIFSVLVFLVFISLYVFFDEIVIETGRDETYELPPNIYIFWLNNIKVSLLLLSISTQLIPSYVIFIFILYVGYLLFICSFFYSVQWRRRVIEIKYPKKKNKFSSFIFIIIFSHTKKKGRKEIKRINLLVNKNWLRVTYPVNVLCFVGFYATIFFFYFFISLSVKVDDYLISFVFCMSFLFSSSTC